MNDHAAADGASPTATSRTLRAVIAVDLASLPLTQLFKTQHWLIDAWVTTAIVLLPAAAVRSVRAPRVWQTWLGVALMVPWLTARFASAHALGGLIPTGATWHQVSDLFDEVRTTTHTSVAPVAAGVAETFVLALVLGLFAALIDLVAVVGRRAALGGVPILVVFTVSGAVPRHPVAWPYFLASAAAFLILLSMDASDTVHGWGRIIPRAGQSRTRATLGVSGSRIGVIAMIIALVGAAFAPQRPANVIANAFHHGSSGSGNGPGGFGAGSGVSLDPFAALRGQLRQGKPVSLFTVTLDHKPSAEPFYLRANVLSTFTPSGWKPAEHGQLQSLSDTTPTSIPPTPGTGTETDFAASIDIKALNDNPPVFSKLQSVDGVGASATWSAADQLLTGPNVHRGQRIVEQITQDEPTPTELAAAYPVDRAAMQQWLAVPSNLPSEVTSLVGKLTAGASSEYAIARALDGYFTTPANGFTYNLDATGGDSGNDLVDFLHSKQGYCQQYAAALAIMLRIAGVPARVVLGYAHNVPDAKNSFTVNTSDAHSWVEAYFGGIGWEPFDPTPLAGITGGARADLAWAPHGSPSQAAPTAIGSTAPSSGSRKLQNLPSDAAAAAARASAHRGAGLGWLVGPLAVAAALALAALPFGARWWRRRSRLRAARLGDPDPLWQELSATARDLGYVWSPARTPRQVERWLGGDLGSSRVALHNLASAVEQSRYAGRAPRGGTLVQDLRAVEAQLRVTRSRGTRLRSRLLPASLDWHLARMTSRLRRRAH